MVINDITAACRSMVVWGEVCVCVCVLGRVCMCVCFLLSKPWEQGALQGGESGLPTIHMQLLFTQTPSLPSRITSLFFPSFFPSFVCIGLAVGLLLPPWDCPMTITVCTGGVGSLYTQDKTLWILGKGFRMNTFRKLLFVICPVCRVNRVLGFNKLHM